MAKAREAASRCSGVGSGSTVVVTDVERAMGHLPLWKREFLSGEAKRSYDERHSRWFHLF
jgi:hypothetical protein